MIGLKRFGIQRFFFTGATGGGAGKHRPAALIFILAALTVLIYANTFRAPFLFDDDFNITGNPHIRMTRLSLSQMQEILESRSNKRPVANFTLAVNYYLHRYEVTGYHVFNLAVHLANGLLVFLLARRTLRLLGRERSLVPSFAAALWLVNPVHIQSVTYVVQRMNSLAALFCMLALYLYIKARTASSNQAKGRPAAWLGLSLLSGLLALGSKENAATLPLMILAYEWFFFQNLGRAFLKKKLPWILAAVLVITAAALLYLGKSPLETISAEYERQPFSMEERLLTQPRVIARYLSLLMLPLPERLNIVHDVAVSTSPVSPPSTLPALIFLALLGATAVLTARKHRLAAFAIVWFLGTLAVESSVIGLALMYEHRTYLPSVFLFIAAADGLGRVRPVWLAYGTLMVLIAVSACWTWQRNSVWNDKIRFWQDTVRKVPHSFRAHNNLSIALAESGRFQEAIEAGRRSIALSPPMVSTARQHNNICRIYHELDKNDTALEYCRQAIRMETDFAEPHMNLGKILKTQNRLQEAVTYLEKAVQLSPHLMPAYLHLAEAIYAHTGRIEEALAVCRQALTVDPEFLKAENKMGDLWLAADEPDRALNHFKTVLRARPDHPEANMRAGLALIQLNNPEAAVVYLAKAAALNPDSARAHGQLGEALLAMGRSSEAENHFLTCLDLAGEDPRVLARLARIQEERQRPDQAVRYYRRALAAAPDSARLRNRLAIALTAAHQYREAEDELLRLARQLPQAPTVDYNLACLYARQGKTDQALVHLKAAIDKGFSDIEALRTSPDLDNLRDTSEYEYLIKKVSDLTDS